MKTEKMSLDVRSIPEEVKDYFTVSNYLSMCEGAHADSVLHFERQHMECKHDGHQSLSKCAKEEWWWLKLTSNRHLTFPSKTREHNLGSNYNQQP